MKNKDIRKYIKDSLKEDFNYDLVLIQIGFMFEAIEEDAVLLSDNCDCMLQGKGKFVSYEITGFPVSALEEYKKILDSINIEYCIVEQIKDIPDDDTDPDPPKSSKKRVVTFSTIDGPHGLMF
jgi:DNA mismatch repair ATPase MutS